MKRKFLLLLIVLLSVCGTYAQSIHNVTLSFKQSEFEFSTDSNGSTVISSHKYSCGYGSDTAEPGLPIIPFNIRVPNNCSYEGFSFTDSKSKIYDNITVAANPKFVPTNVLDLTEEKQVAYNGSTYPSSNVQFVEESKFDGYTVLRFLVCPFVYNTSDNSLCLMSNINLNINLNSVATFSSEAANGGDNMAELVNSISFKPIYKDSITFIEPTPTLPKFDLDAILCWDYLIVTSADLADNFQTLASWKKLRGVKSHIVTIEEIKEKYNEKDLQLSIKTYLRDMYKKKSIKYVLLGGDDTVVPARMCKYYNNGETPSDLYYACFGDDLSWDANGNGIYGEYNDDINMNPSIFVTRVPVRTAQDVDAFVNKVIGYEKNPKGNGWGNNILMSGYKLFSDAYDVPGQSDSKVKGDLLYENYIGTYWDGTRTRLYDTFTDVSPLSEQSIQHELQQGYTFADFICHGSPAAWGTGTSCFYMKEDAADLVNPRYTIITTNSCLTNAFDHYTDKNGYDYGGDPCLSEAFIRNPKSGVIAYLGCSREGFGTIDKKTILGPSLRYNAQFYEKLFSPAFSTKNYGQIVAAAKQEFVGECKTNSLMRWIQLGLNPIGDPEMPIYTSTPLEFKRIIASYDATKSELLVTSDSENCDVTVMSANDCGETLYHVKRDTNSTLFKVEEGIVQVCVSRQNYVPCVFTCDIDKEKEKIFSLIVVIEGNKANGNIDVKTNIGDGVKEAKLVVSSVNDGSKTTVNIPTDTKEYTTTIDTSKLCNGVNIISLYANGKLVDSKNFIKK